MTKKFLVLIEPGIVRMKEEMRRAKNFTLHTSHFALPFAGLVIGLLLLAGCGGRLSRLEADYGTSHALAKLNQTVTPDAAEKSVPVYRFDGQAAQEAVVRYRNGFGTQANASAKTVSTCKIK